MNRDEKWINVDNVVMGDGLRDATVSVIRSTPITLDMEHYETGTIQINIEELLSELNGICPGFIQEWAKGNH